MSFPFENLEVYKRSLTFIEKTENICSSLKDKSSFSIRDQMTRASLSISLNIAEGNGRWHKKDRIHFLHIARGSVFEIVPIIQVLHRKGAFGLPPFSVSLRS